MLETLRIRNIAIIDSAEIPFRKGLNILSGETGAGKSIVIEAISLLLGGRGSADLIRSGCEEAVVEGAFEVSEHPWMRQRLEKLGFDPSNDPLLLKRVVSRNGRSRVHVNGELATVAMLQQLGDGLVDLCGQHEHQSLVRPSVQLDLLDRYGGLVGLAQDVGIAFDRFRASSDELSRLRGDETGRSARADFLRFQIDEISQAALQTGEDVKLQEEKRLLQSAESRVQLAQASRSAVDSGEEGAIVALRAAIAKARALQALDPSVETTREPLERALAECEDACSRLDRYVSAVDLNPERLSAVQDRLSLIAALRKKYGASVEEMLSTLSRLENELGGLTGAESRMGELAVNLEHARETLAALAADLGKRREKFAETFGTSVTAELADLRMGEARLDFEVSHRSGPDSWSRTGADDVQLVVRTNAGEPSRPLGKIASGGELSRLMLAIRRVIADRGGIGVYLFDEIDAGIGGQTAFEVGRKLKSVAQYNQVICITHLPQVASFADHHLTVRKRVQGSRTLTEVGELSPKDRRDEIARMLAGPKLTQRSLESAAELIRMSR